jgi:hypothetical protein
MTIKVRLSGEPEEIARLVEHLRAEFDVAGADRAYPNRGSFGVRVYLELRDQQGVTPTQRARAQRVDGDRQGLEP